jgi:hypothetical protein
VAGGGTAVTTFSGGSTGLTPSTATSGAVTLGGTLAVANGGTNTTTLTANKVMVGNGTSGVLTPTNLHWDNTNSRLGVSQSSPVHRIDVNGNSRFSGDVYLGVYNNSNKYFLEPFTNLAGGANNGYIVSGANDNNHRSGFIIQNRDSNGETYNSFICEGEDSPTPTTSFHILSDGFVKLGKLAGTGTRAVNAASDGTLSAASSILIKENVENINYGLADVLKLKPVSFNYINKKKWGEGKDLGFIAEDVMNVIPEATGVMNNSDIYFDLQKLIPILTKAIQEQQALIKALEQRIINLENK